ADCGADLGRRRIEKNERRAPAPAAPRPVARREAEESEPGESDRARNDCRARSSLCGPGARKRAAATTGAAPRAHAAARKAAEAVEGPQVPRTFPASAKPRLVASEAVPVGSVVQIVRD